VLQGLIDALGVFFQWPNPAWVLGGVLFGMLIGILPGMAGSVALALLIPLSFTMDTELAVLFLIGAYSPAGFGGMLTSILVNTPGDPANAATTFDGYPMTKQGRSGAAIGGATAASVFGGLLGTAALLALIPVAQKLILSFSYPEFLMMAVLGLTVIAVITERNTFKALMASAVGFLIAFIGLNPITGAPRFTFDELYLYDGIDVVPVLMGLFAGAEILALFGKGTTISQKALASAEKDMAHVATGTKEPVTFWDGVRATMSYKFLIVRTSLIGVLIGIIPGVGGSVSSFLAYSHAKQTSKNPGKFGRGAIDGVIAAESANDAKEGGSLLPTVAFGIPGTVGMAVLLGALIMQGIPVGPSMMVDHVDIVYLLIVGMVMSKLIAPIVVWLIAKRAIHITRLRPGLFTPLIAVAALLGAYTINIQILDVVVTLIFAYVGYAMRRYGFSRVALIIALVLGSMVERSYYQTVATFDDATIVLRRPISAVLFALTVLFLGYAIFMAVRRYKRGEKGHDIDADDEEDLTAVDARQPGRLLFDAVLLAFALTILVSATEITTDARTMPLLFSGLAVAGLGLIFVRDIVPFLRRRPTPDGQLAPDAQSTGGSGTGRTEATSLPAAGGASTGTTTSVHDLQIAQSQQDDALVELSGSTVLWRQAAFSAWTVGLVVLGALVGFAIAIPISTLLFLRYIAKESWFLAVTIAAGSGAFFYLLFDVALGRSLL
jgi:putative tricarboxylic transport membrane protein